MSVREEILSDKSSVLGTVLIVCPGGLEHGGGIGRQMGYFLRAQRQFEQRVSYRIVDTRGPWFIGTSLIYASVAVFYLMNAVLSVLTARVLTTSCGLHVNIAGRGSTMRKVILLTIARAIGLRYLLHIHDYDYSAEYGRRGRLMRWAIARTFQRAVRILVLGEREATSLKKLLCLTPERVSVLHNAVPDLRPKPAKKSRSGDCCHLLFLGHLSERKGVPELLDALATPSLLNRQWRATLAGGGPIDRFRLRAQELGIADRVNFPGWIDTTQVQTLRADSDVLVLPSHAEGLAMSVLEGLSDGLTVITTPVGAHPEVIDPEVSGIFVPPGDVEALENALARVIDNGELRRRLGEGARRRFLQDFDVARYAGKLRQLHIDLLFHSRDVINNKGRNAP